MKSLSEAAQDRFRSLGRSALELCSYCRGPAQELLALPPQMTLQSAAIDTDLQRPEARFADTDWLGKEVPDDVL
eukprot:1413295-Rhodomonas_salina.4